MLILIWSRVAEGCVGQSTWETVARAASGMQKGGGKGKLQRALLPILEARTVGAMLFALRDLSTALGTTLHEVGAPCVAPDASGNLSRSALVACTAAYVRPGSPETAMQGRPIGSSDCVWVCLACAQVRDQVARPFDGVPGSGAATRVGTALKAACACPVNWKRLTPSKCARAPAFASFAAHSGFHRCESPACMLSPNPLSLADACLKQPAV